MPQGPFNSCKHSTQRLVKPVNSIRCRSLKRRASAPISKLPVSIRIVLESVLRNCDGKKITEDDVRALANWQPNGERTEEVPFVVARVLLQDFTGVPLLVDLAAMRSAVARLRKNPEMIEPLAPADLVIDHSIQVDFCQHQRRVCAKTWRWSLSATTRVTSF